MTDKEKDLRDEQDEIEFEEDLQPIGTDADVAEIVEQTDDGGGAEIADESAEAEGEGEEGVAERKQREEPIFAEPDEPIETTVESVIEAILFASDESLSPTKLAAIVEVTTKQVNEAVRTLNEKYKAGNHSFRIVQIAGGYQMLTLSPYNLWLQKLVRARGDSKLSAAAMETLAIIAYKQPIIRADVEAIRGVAAGEMIRSLMYKGLVKITGRADILGRPMLYGTTKKFLEVFGLNSLKDLPKIEELKKPEQ
ncbi:MAG: SMC-Scp complex subunit ScpB [Phycisphaerae bacterium]